MYRHTLSAASAVYDLTTNTDAQLVPLCYGPNSPTSDHELGDQIASVDVLGTTNGGAAVIAFVLWDPVNAQKIRIVEATVTSTALRTSQAGGASGLFLCTVAFADGTNKIDLNGAGPVKTIAADGTETPGLSGKARWYVCCKSDAGSLLPMTVCVSPTRAI